MKGSFGVSWMRRALKFKHSEISFEKGFEENVIKSV